MSEKETNRNKMRLMARKCFNTKEGLLLKARSIIQQRLNLQTPPDKGRIFKRNTIEYLGLSAARLQNPNGRIIFSPFSPGICRIYLESKYKKEPWLEHHSWTVDLNKADQGGWTLKRSADRADHPGAYASTDFIN
ncbi:MAG: hypothetical protein RDV00_06855 [Clostridia bacterium]|nr:hypothetical protein [Clostridia bacterium]MDQ7791819.1 hypothetical protein [Clostridia bacterium]